MDIVFWTAACFMACLLLARLILPLVAPDARISGLLRKHVSFVDVEGASTDGLETPEAEPHQG